MLKVLSLEDIKQIKIKPILFGLLAEFGVAVVIFLPIFSVALFFIGPSTDNFTKSSNFLERFFENRAFNIFSSIIPGIIGGYVAAHYANTLRITHAFGTGLLSILLGMVINAIPEMRTPYDLENVSYLISSIPTAMLGGYLKVRLDAFKVNRTRKPRKD